MSLIVRNHLENLAGIPKRQQCDCKKVIYLTYRSIATVIVEGLYLITRN